MLSLYYFEQVAGPKLFGLVRVYCNVVKYQHLSCVHTRVLTWVQLASAPDLNRVPIHQDICVLNHLTIWVEIQVGGVHTGVESRLEPSC